MVEKEQYPMEKTLAGAKCIKVGENEKAVLYYGRNGYELHVKRWQKEDKSIFNSVIKAGTALFASNEQFGTYGWSYSVEENAVKALNAFLE